MTKGHYPFHEISMPTIPINWVGGMAFLVIHGNISQITSPRRLVIEMARKTLVVFSVLMLALLFTSSAVLAVSESSENAHGMDEVAGVLAQGM